MLLSNRAWLVQFIPEEVVVWRDAECRGRALARGASSTFRYGASRSWRPAGEVGIITQTEPGKRWGGKGAWSSFAEVWWRNGVLMNRLF